LFQLPEAGTLLHRILRETKERYGFEMRGFQLEGARLTFYIKPDDGLQLPKIMQWMKQTFSARFNARTGRAGHVWGERYWPEILWGGPPEGAEEVDWEVVNAEVEKPIPADTTYILTWASPRLPGVTITTSFSAKNASEPASPPG
jgi:hypothetical protein